MAVNTDIHNDKTMADEKASNFHENLIELFIVQAIKMCGLVEILLHSYLTWALGGREWSALGPSRFTSGGKSARYPFTGGHVGPTGGMDAFQKTLCLCQILNPYPSIVQPVRWSLC